IRAWRGTNSAVGIASIAARTPSSVMPRRRNCVSTIRFRSEPQPGITTAPARIIAIMAHQITLIPGDGIGPEVAAATVRAVEATGAPIEWETANAGATALAQTGEMLPDSVMQSTQATPPGLKTPTTPPVARA